MFNEYIYCLVMARNLTQWEKDRIKDMDNLIKKCESRHSEFKSKCEELSHILDTDAANDLKEWLRQELRYFAIDLHSVLDYLCYLCYGHFKNNGNNPSDSPEIRNVHFPYTKDLKKSDVDGQEVSFRRQREKFVRGHFTTIFGPQDAFTQERYNRFKEIILNCQVRTSIGADGQALQQQDQMTKAATCFNTLHCLRNITAHRHIVDITVSDNDCHEVRRLGCWIAMENGKSPRPLLSVTANILDFVVNTRNELLKIAFPDGTFLYLDVVECPPELP